MSAWKTNQWRFTAFFNTGELPLPAENLFQNFFGRAHSETVPDPHSPAVELSDSEGLVRRIAVCAPGKIDFVIKAFSSMTISNTPVGPPPVTRSHNHFEDDSEIVATFVASRTAFLQDYVGKITRIAIGSEAAYDVDSYAEGRDRLIEKAGFLNPEALSDAVDLFFQVNRKSNFSVGEELIFVNRLVQLTIHALAFHVQIAEGNPLLLDNHRALVMPDVNTDPIVDLRTKNVGELVEIADILHSLNFDLRNQ